MIVPAGKRRQMESQSYLWNEHEGQVDGIIENMLRKAAALDIAPSEAAGELAAPKPQVEPAETVPGQADVANAMDQSNTLPQEQGTNRNRAQGEFETKVTAVAQDVLGSLNLDPSQWATDTHVSTGPGGDVETISINLKRSKTEAGPVIQKP